MSPWAYFMSFQRSIYFILLYNKSITEFLSVLLWQYVFKIYFGKIGIFIGVYVEFKDGICRLSFMCSKKYFIFFLQKGLCERFNIKGFKCNKNYSETTYGCKFYCVQKRCKYVSNRMINGNVTKVLYLEVECLFLPQNVKCSKSIFAGKLCNSL